MSSDSSQTSVKQSLRGVLSEWLRRAAGCVCLAALLLAITNSQAQEIASYLMVKYGDESADPEMAMDFLADLSRYLEQAPCFRGKLVRGWIANTPELAKALMEKHQPVLAFAPPGFHLMFLDGDKDSSTPILQLPRFGAEIERYYLVASKSGPENLRQLQGHTVRSTFSVDSKYLRAVVFPREFAPGDFFKLQPSGNLADEVFLMVENESGGFGTGETGAASALLFDEETKRFFEEDEMVWPKLKTIWSSDPLPRDLVICIGDSWTNERKEQLRDALLTMPDGPQGEALLELMQSSGFGAIDAGMLTQVVRKYRAHGK